MKIEAKDRQCVADVALQVCGSIEAAFVVAARNELSITDSLASGQVLEYEIADTLDGRVVAAYAENRILPVMAVPVGMYKDLTTIPVIVPGDDIGDSSDTPPAVAITKIFTAEFDTIFG